MPIDQNQIVVKDAIDRLPAAKTSIPDIEFKHVTFSYLGKRNDVEDISFALYPGQTLGIMGATGSGKSTLIRLLLRQYDVTEGQILIRGVPLEKVPTEALKSLFGSVFQNDFLFGDTIRANIDFGRKLPDDKLLHAATDAQAIEFIDEKEGGLDFTLASKGVNLSGGQKQRLLISRALAGNPDILILDDAASALDFKTESRFRKALLDYDFQTTIIVAQRVSSVLQADNILFFDKGRIIAQGDHEHLMRTCEPYREIASLQMGEAS